MDMWVRNELTFAGHQGRVGFVRLLPTTHPLPLLPHPTPPWTSVGSQFPGTGTRLPRPQRTSPGVEGPREKSSGGQRNNEKTCSGLYLLLLCLCRLR